MVDRVAAQRTRPVRRGHGRRALAAVLGVPTRHERTCLVADVLEADAALLDVLVRLRFSTPSTSCTSVYFVNLATCI